MEGSQFNALDAVNVAIEMERSGHKFYTGAAALARDENGKEMFSRLANDELAHVYWLMAVRQSLIKTGEFGDVDQLVKDGGTASQEDLPAFPLSARGFEITPETRELEALEMGIQAEKDSIAFYEKAAEMTEDPAGRALFKRLADWEDEHRRLLEAEHDYLENSGFYLGIAEFHLEGPEYLSWWRR